MFTDDVVTHFTFRTWLALVVKVEFALWVTWQLSPIRISGCPEIPEQIHRDRWRMKLGRAEWKVGNCPDVLLELTGEAALDAVMARVVWASAISLTEAIHPR